ncbi:MAG: oligosaccharide flippase family protein [Candidatus Omnitrophica bacterium]|nr:oligosaccharide flippase family protein [Candidatus Omnitrophota bacterium]
MKLDRLIKDAGIMFFAVTTASVFNLLFQLFMVRMLNPVDFGILNTLLSMTIVIAMPLGPLQAVVTKFVAGFKANNQSFKIHAFLLLFLKKILIISIVVFLLVLICSNKIAVFFKLENNLMVIMVGFMMLLSALLPYNLGGLQGLQKFKSLGAASIINAVLRLAFGVLLVNLGLRVWGALTAIVMASLIALLFSFIPLKPYFFMPRKESFKLDEKELDLKAIYRYFLPAFIALPSFGLLTSMDIVLVKHYFSPMEAGYYSVAQMIGKIILFLPGAVTMVMFPKITENYTRNEETVHILKKCLIAVATLSFSAGLFCVIFPEFVLKILSGRVLLECIPLVMPFSLSMSFFALSSVFLYYHLSVHNMKFIYVFLVFVILEAVLIILFHRSLLEVLYVLCACSIMLFIVNTLGIKKAVKA